jgi:hypothetical protein
MLYFIVVPLFCRIKVLRWLENIFFAKNFSIFLKEKDGFENNITSKKKGKDCLYKKMR